MNTKAFTIETVTITGSIHTDTIEVTSANPESFFLDFAIRTFEAKVIEGNGVYRQVMLYSCYLDETGYEVEFLDIIKIARNGKLITFKTVPDIEEKFRRIEEEYAKVPKRNQSAGRYAKIIGSICDTAEEMHAVLLKVKEQSNYGLYNLLADECNYYFGTKFKHMFV